MIEATKKKRACASFLKRLVMWWKARRHKQCINSIREHLEFFGVDTSGMTDEQVEEHVLNVGKQMAKCGITAQQAADGFMKLNKLSNNSETTRTT